MQVNAIYLGLLLQSEAFHTLDPGIQTSRSSLCNAWSLHPTEEDFWNSSACSMRSLINFLVTLCQTIGAPSSASSNQATETIRRASKHRQRCRLHVYLMLNDIGPCKRRHAHAFCRPQALIMLCSAVCLCFSDAF